MVKQLFIGIILFFLFSNSSFSGISCCNLYSTPADSNSILKEEGVKTLQTLTPSVKAQTSQGNEYNLYAIRKGKEWTYLVADNSGYYSLKQVKGKEEIIENDQAYTDMILLMVKAKLIVKIAKPRNVAGMTFSCYYKFKPKAKTMYNQYKTIQRKVKVVNTDVKSGASGILKLFKK